MCGPILEKLRNSTVLPHSFSYPSLSVQKCQTSSWSSWWSTQFMLKVISLSSGHFATVLVFSFLFIFFCSMNSLPSQVSCSVVSDSLHRLYIHGILQARTLEWVASPFPRGSSQPREPTRVSCITDRFFTSWATKEAQQYWSGYECLRIFQIFTFCFHY